MLRSFESEGKRKVVVGLPQRDGLHHNGPLALEALFFSLIHRRPWSQPQAVSVEVGAVV